MFFTTIETERLLIRRFEASDWHALFEYASNPEVVRYLSEEPFTEEYAKQFIHDIRDLLGFPIRVAVTLKDSGRLIGHLSFKVFSERHRVREIGWVFHPDVYHRGYATEAAGALFTYGFNQLGLHRIVATCDTRNTQSFRLMERLGMRREGHSIQCSFYKGEWADEFFYAILANEWVHDVV